MKLLYRLFILLSCFVTNASIFLPSRVYALSPEKTKEAQDYAKRAGEEAIKKAHESGAYDYNTGLIIGTVIRSIIIFILWYAFFIIYKKHFWKYRIARILFIPISLFLSLFLFITTIILGFL